MAVRPYLTTGAAIVSAGALIAALPAIVPSPTPPDVKVAASVPKNPYVYDVKLQATLQEFVDIFFDSGFDGITRQLLLDLVGNFEPGQAAINGVFDTGFEELVQLWLVRNTTDPAQLRVINGFFDGSEQETPAGDFEIPGGFTNAIFQLLISNVADGSREESLLGGFFSGGFDEIARQILLANVPADSDQADLINGFFGGSEVETPAGDFEIPGGFTNLIFQVLNANVVDGSREESLLGGFFGGGFDEIARQVLEAAAPDQAGKDLVNTFFADGFDGLAETFALALVAADPGATGAVNSFFSGYPFAIPDDETTEDVDESVPAGKAGFVGLIHYVIDSLIGGVVQPVVEEEEPEPETLLSVEENADLSKVSTTIDPNAKVSTFDLKIEDKVEAAVEPDDAVTATAAIDSAPAAQPAVVPAPVPAPETTPPAEPVVDDGVVDVPEEEGEEEVVEVDNPGNKFTPPPILLYGNNGKRENPWRKAWQDTVKTVTGGGSTTPDAAPAPDDNAGDPE